MKTPLGLCILLISLVLSACGGEAARLVADAPLISVQATDARGQTVRLLRRPERIVALGPGGAEAVVALGAGHRLVAVSDQLDDAHWRWPLPDVARLRAQGGLALDDIEALRPDLLLIDAGSYPPELIEQVARERRLTVFVVATRPYATVAEGWRLLGRLLGRPSTGDSLATALTAHRDHLTRLAEGQTPYVALAVLPAPVEGGPLAAAGGATLLNELMHATAVKAAYRQLPLERVAVSPDSLLTLAPEWIVLVATSEQFFLEWLGADPRLQELPAVRTERIILMPPDQLLHTGPSCVLTQGALLKIFHPQLEVPTLPGDTLARR